MRVLLRIGIGRCVRFGAMQSSVVLNVAAVFIFWPISFVSIFLAAILAATSSLAQSFENIAGLTDGGDVGASVAQSSGRSIAISANGLTVAGADDTTSGLRASSWNATGGLTTLGVLPGFSESMAFGISSDGATIAGTSFTSNGGSPPSIPAAQAEAFVWTASGGIVGLGPNSRAFGVSGDGTTIIGNTNAGISQAFHWTAATGIVGLGYLLGGSGFSYAYGVNSDGSVIVGYSDSTFGAQAFRWTASGGMARLTNSGASSYATAVNADGSVIAGVINSANTQAFRWTAGAGLVELGILPGGSYTRAFALSADGSVIVGTGDTSAGQQQAIRWTASTGIQSIQDILTANGISLNGTTLIYAGGVSSDGLTIVGGGSQIWLANIPLNAFALLDLQGVDHSIGSLVWGGTVTNNSSSLATLTVGSDNTSTSFKGTIQDGRSATALTKIGSGTLTLTGTNTYTGGTVISGGTLQLGDANNLGKIVGSVSNSANFNIFNADTSGITSLTNSSATNFFNNTNASNVVIGNSGTLVFNDTSSAGSATITNNYLTQFLNNSTAGNASITNNSVIDFRNFGTAGNASITNNNYMEFSGTSTAGSSTIINNLPLFSGSDLAFLGNSTGGQARFVNNAGATIDFTGTTGPNGDNKITAGSIEGAGKYYLGANELTVGGNNLSTTVTGIVSDGGSGSVNPFATGGAIAKVGTGILTLTNTSTYTGATTVNAGTLSVTGDISKSSGVTVNAGGALTGIGTVGNTSINGGTFQPGSGTAGTSMIVSGTLGLSASAAYMVTVSPTISSLANVSGTATLGSATVNAIFASGSFVTKQYTILHSAGLSGTFGSLSTTNLPANFTTNLSYTNTDALLNITAALGQPTPGQPPQIGGSSGNQSNVANALNSYFNNGGTLPPAFVTLFGLTGSALTNALTQISGEAGGHGGSHAATGMMGSFLTLALNPFGGSSGGNIGSVGGGRGFGFAAEQEPSPEAALAYAAVTPKGRLPVSTVDRLWGVWGQAYGGLNKTGGDVTAGTHDTTSRSYGLATGADYRASPDLTLGFAFAGGGTNYGLSEGLGGGRSDVFQMGVYGSKQYGKAYVSAALSYAWHGMKTDRTVTVSGTDNLTASFIAHSFGGRLESGYRLDVPVVSITPYAALQMQQFRTPSYTETAKSGSDAFALSYDAKSTTSTRTELGVWLDKMIALDRGNVLAIRTRVAWAHDHSSDESSSAAFQTLSGSNFTVNGAGNVPNSALMSAGAEIRLASGISVGAKFDGEFADHSQTYAGTVNVRSVW